MSERAEVVFVSGKFRVIHAGHMRFFRSAAELGQKLVVALDTKELSLEEIKWRVRMLESIEYVDEVVRFDGDIRDILRAIRPDVVVKGQEFRNVENLETAILSEFGGKLVFTSGANFYSETDLISGSYSQFVENLIQLPQDFMVRNEISTDRLVYLVQKFSKLKVCVVGDLIIDEYINCHPLGMSEEEPTVVVTPIDRKMFFGGAGIVAAHCQSLGSQTTLMTVTGKDNTSKWAQEKASEYGINSVMIVDSGRPTTLKQRFRSGSQTLLKISHLNQDFLDAEREEELIEKFLDLARELDVVIFSDFSYGVLSPYAVKKMLKIAHQQRIFVSADSQTSSQIGNLGKFNTIDLVSATEREARIELRDNTSGLVSIAESLRTELNARNLLLKMGADGVLISGLNSSGKALATDQIVALNKNPIDTSGAGDSMLAGATLALACGSSIYEAALLGSILAGIQIGRLGNVPISQEAIDSLLHL